MAELQIIFEFADGSQEIVRDGSLRYWELIEDGHTPIGSVPESDGVSDALEAYLAGRFGAQVDTSDGAVALALNEGTEAPAAVQVIVDGSVDPLAARVDTAEGELEGRLSASALSDTISTQAVGRSVSVEHAPALGMFFPEAEGAARDGSTDDTAAIEAADTAAAASGGKVYLRAGSYYTATGITVTGGGLVGAGKLATNILAPQGVSAIYTTTSRTLIEGFRLACTTVGPSSGAGIHINGNPLYVTLRDLHIYNFYDDIDHESGNSTTFDNILGIARRYGVRIRNVTNPDAGDHNMVNCQWDTETTGAAGVRIESSGGLKIVNTKFFRSTWGVDLAVADITTSILTITGCSIEAPNCIRLGRSGTTGTYVEATITGNQLHATLNGYGVQINAGVSAVTVTGNAFKGGGGTGLAGVALNGGERHVVSGNTFNGFAKGITIATGMANFLIGDNAYNDVVTPVEDNTNRDQPSPGTIVRRHRRALSALTSDVTYTNLWRIDLNTYRAAEIHLVLEGIVNGSAGFARRAVKLLARDAGNVVVTDVLSVATGTSIDVQYDVSSTPGSVFIGVKRATGVGTSVSGSVSLEATGGIKSITRV